MRMILGVAAIGLLAACNAQAPAGNQAQPANVDVAANTVTAVPQVAPIDARSSVVPV